MSNFRFTGLGAGTARTDSAQLGQLQDSTLYYLTSVAGTNTVTGSVVPAITAYVTGQQFLLTPAATNTGATTLNINSVGAGAVQSRAQALVGGELIASVPVIVACVTTTPVFGMLGSAPFADSRPLVVGSADATKKLRFEVDGLTTATTRVATPPNRNFNIGEASATQTSDATGTAVTFTVSSFSRNIVVIFFQVGTNGTSVPIIQIGAGGVETTLYNGTTVSTASASTTATQYSSGFALTGTHTAASLINGIATLNIGVDDDVTPTYSWAFSWAGGRSDAAVALVGGGIRESITAGRVDTVRITTVNGTDAFDAGSISVFYGY